MRLGLLLFFLSIQVLGFKKSPALKFGWRFEEGTGTTANDISGNGFNGTFVNSPTWTFGKFGRGLAFDGTNGAVSLGTAPSLDIGILTVMFWANTAVNAPDVWRRVVSTPAAFTNNYVISYPGDASPSVSTRAIIVFFKGAGFQTPTNSFLPNVWNHVAMVYNGLTLSIYINGVLQTLTTPGFSSGPSTTDFLIGNRQQLDKGFDGTLDELRVYSKALTASEIRAEMSGHSPGGL